MKKLSMKQLEKVVGAGGGGLVAPILGGLVSSVIGGVMGGLSKPEAPRYLEPPKPLVPTGLEQEASKQDIDKERTDKARARAIREQQSKSKNLLFLEEDEGE